MRAYLQKNCVMFLQSIQSTNLVKSIAKQLGIITRLTG